MRGEPAGAGGRVPGMEAQTAAGRAGTGPAPPEQAGSQAAARPPAAVVAQAGAREPTGSLERATPPVPPASHPGQKRRGGTEPGRFEDFYRAELDRVYRALALTLRDPQLAQ